MYDNLAYEDFNRAYRRSFWRRVRARLTGESIELLPYDLVREDLPFTSQHDIGLQTVPVDKIVGSVGRYRDFDRAFLPTQRETTTRWVNISKARYEDIALPPVDLYKIGDVYFVKDGNHRISVARERQQAFVDAFVTEIDIPFALTADMAIDDVEAQKAYGRFRQETQLDKIRPDHLSLVLTHPDEYQRLHEHINAHRYYLGTENRRDIPNEEAVGSWYDNVYRPLIETITTEGLEDFAGLTLTDLYLRVSEYQWLLREAARDSMSDEEPRLEALDRLAEIYQIRNVRQVIRRLRHANWLDDTIREKEEEDFLERTNISGIRPEAHIEASLPGKYERILEHIDVHRYYLGLERQEDVSFEEAVASWYDHVYMPLIELVRQQDILDQFPHRTETDAYIWLVDHREEWEADSQRIREAEDDQAG